MALDVVGSVPVADSLIDRTGDLLPRVWAHLSLRLVDWSIRHHPADVEHWLRVAERHLFD
jgi:hypothetical protein